MIIIKSCGWVYLGYISVIGVWVDGRGFLFWVCGYNDWAGRVGRLSVVCTCFLVVALCIVSLSNWV